ncbi:MAG: transcription termination factor NusA [Candidatus Omnitrophica bacterium]|nr:transcription termination factor NusA [Candidatus Omnitrophota bacterium]MDD5671663.1 transcription termination factor NusA [Candidatus Omnitrophota bacterium]
MSQELLSSLESIEKEKGIRKEVLIDAIRQALMSACRKTYPDWKDTEIQINPDTFDIHLLSEGKEVYDAGFGRIAAQTAKQVIIQKIREAERDSIYTDFNARQGDIISGEIHRIEKKAFIVDLGKAEGILPAREQSPVDDYRQGDIIRSYVLEVKKTPRGPEIILSRAHAGLVKRLFELEVPEIHEGIVQIKGVAREAGSRTKIAVASQDEKIDCVGSCVGVRGQRVKNIVRELGGEKIDIVRFSDDFEAYLKNAMAPAELAEIKTNRENQSAEILVQDDQLSLAIGKKGQNVRLASKLLGWRLDVRSLSQKVPLSSLDGVGDKTSELLKQAGVQSLKDILKSSPEDLMKIPGIGEKTAEKIIAAAQKALLEKDS